MEVTEEDLISQFQFVGKEKDLEDYILDNIDLISEKCGWGKVANVDRQRTIRFGKSRIIIDLLVVHEDNTSTIIEVKKSSGNRNDIIGGIGQVLFYSTMLETLIHVNSRLVIISSEFSLLVNSTINKFQLPIDLIMVDGDRCIYLPHKFTS
jgi:RecB family endonuclease NucS